MRVLVASAHGAPVVAVSDLASAAANPVWDGLSLWRFDGEAFPGYPLPAGAELVERPAPVASAADLAAYAANARWEREVAGTTWNGMPVATDDRSKTLVNGELSAIDLGVRQDGEQFEFADGVPRPLSNADMQAVAIAMRSHVKATFGLLFTALAGIEAGTVTTAAGVDAILAGAAA